MKIKYPEGATPLDPNELEGLIPQYLTVQAQLNRWEQENILEAEIWLSRQKLTYKQLLNISFALKVHKRMFNKTWRWAGTLRKTDKNIGSDRQNIAIHLKQLFDDVTYQIEYHSYSIDEICVRFHHRIVAIHPFVNGNGRHARLLTDKLVSSLARPRFTWGRQNLSSTSAVRKQYIEALRCADKGDYQRLIAFARI